MSAALRWTDEEHNILVVKTNKQIELEANDPSMEISWSTHWQLVSKALDAHGYSRTPGACQVHWKRTINSQVASEEAAGSRWDDSEHQILMGMTEDQLVLESIDPSSIIPWPQHWKKVSLRLQKSGHTRSVDECAAYWDLVQNHSFVTAESGTDTEAPSPEDDVRSLNHETGGDSLPQDQTDAQPWTDVECENLTRLVNAQLKGQNGAEDLSDTKLWTVVSQLHQQAGFDRTGEACKAYWQDRGRLRDQPDNRPKSASREGVGRVSIESNPSNLSAMWSPVNMNSPIVSEPNVSEEGTSTKSPRTIPQAQMLASTNQVSSTAHPAFTITNKIVMLNSETPKVENTQGEDDKSTLLEKPREKQRRHRFTMQEKAFLKAEAAKNGTSPDLERREELAKQMGAEEKTIRNWFISFRRGNRRIQEELSHRNSINSNVSDMDNSFASEQSYSTPEPKFKRTYGSLDRDASTKDVSPNSGPLMKKPRQDDRPSPLNNEQANVNIGRSPANIIVPVSNDTLHNANLHEVVVTPADIPLTSREATVNPEPTSTILPFPNPEDVRIEKTREPNPEISNSESFSEDRSSRYSSSTANQFPESSTATPHPTLTTLGENQSSHYSSNTNPILLSNSTTPQPASTSFTTPSTFTSDRISEISSSTPQPTSTSRTIPVLLNPLPSDDAEEKAWAARRLETFQIEIQHLERDNAARSAMIYQIERDIEEAERKDRRLHQQEEEELAEAVRIIKEKYDKEREFLRDKQNTLHWSRESEVETMKKNELAIARKKTGMDGMRALVAYHGGV